MSLYGKERGYDVFDMEESDSDVDASSSSEDEINVILHGTPEQRRKLQHLYNKQKSNGTSSRKTHFTKTADSSSEDDFEKEMNEQLNQEVQSLQKAMRGDPEEMICDAGTSGAKALTTSTPSSSHKGKAPSMADQFYDDVYFDSDEEDEGAQVGKKSKSQHAVISNDDLLYDPTMDDKDQQWVDKQRQSHRRSQGGSKSGKKEKMPNSDALLDCPACLTTLCIDCQRHDVYKHQYRAMFVMNCFVDKTESLQCPEQTTKKQKKKKKKNKSGNPSDDGTSEPNSFGDGNSSDLFNPVKCTECNTVVGVIDTDEVYHFFNVLSSHT